MRFLAWIFVLFLASAHDAEAQSAGLKPAALIYGCGSREEVERQALYRLAVDEPRAERRDDDLRAGRQAVLSFAALKASALTGKTVDEPYNSAAIWARHSAKAASPQLAELFRRVFDDQIYRFHRTAAMRRISWAHGLSDNARAYAYYIIASEGCGVDEQNTVWLKNQIQISGWFTISKYGEKADNAAWLITQHADRDPAFQQYTLRVLEPLIARKESNPINYAYLFDRIAVNNKRPQLYGTQGRCTSAGIWEPWNITAAEVLDERRMALGLQPQAEYNKSFSCQAVKSE